MRTLKSVLRWLSPGIFALVLILNATVPVHADTGTYKISEYTTTLEPQSSGAVKITYRQKWQVLSGNIPWITVGLPNTNFTVVDWGGDASRVYPENSSGFTGVKIDLDRTYYTGDIFEVSFTITQNNLLEKLSTEKKWRIMYVPGWYDRAVIDKLTVILDSPVNPDTYSLIEPTPIATENNVFTWERVDLAPGARFQVKVECLDGSFLSATTPGAKKSTFPWAIVIGILMAAVVIYLIVIGIRRVKKAQDAALKERIAATERELATDEKKKEAAEKGFREYIIKEDIQPDEQGRYYDRNYGDYITPAIWAAVILNQQSVNRSTSCVHSSCACVSCACACACACAGGGAAGCSRKTIHECRDCDKCRINATLSTQGNTGVGTGEKKSNIS
jgi:hypothetical protein